MMTRVVRWCICRRFNSNMGRTIARDFETSKETLGYDTPQEYRNDERVNALKERLRAGIGILKQIIGYSCNAY